MGAAHHHGVDPRRQQGRQVGKGLPFEGGILQIPRFNQGHEGRTAHLQHLGMGVAGMDRPAVGAATDRGRGGQHADAVAVQLGRHAVDQAHHRHAGPRHGHI